MNKIYATNQKGTFVTLLMTIPDFLVRIKSEIGSVKAVYEIPKEFYDGVSADENYTFVNPQNIIDIDFDEHGVYILVDFPVREYKFVRLFSNVMHHKENRILTPEEIVNDQYLNTVKLKFVYLEI